jgi:metal-sulfur cluster biosynthetic enzyme
VEEVMAPDMTLREQILMNLVGVIDPETGVDVLRMRLVEDLEVDQETGIASYRFRPSSPLCPLAHSLALDIKRAVGAVPGIAGQRIEVAGYVKAAELTELINQESV